MQAVLSGAVATTQPQVTVCASDQSSSGYAGLAPVRTTLNSTTDVTILSAPAASTFRDVDYLSVYNADTASVTVTIKFDQSGADTIILTVTLATLEQLEFTHGSGWKVLTASGSIKAGSLSVAGAAGDVQYNAGSNTLGAESAFTYDSTNNQLTIPGATITEDAALSGDISPSQITANQNDYNPTGLSTASVLRLSTDASRDITGLQGGADGRLVIVHNVGAQNLVLKDESASSSAANRFALNADVTLGADQSSWLQYDLPSSRWRVIGGTGSSVTPGGASGDVQYNSGASTFAAEAAFNYNSGTNTLTLDNLTANGLIDISAAGAGQIKFPASQNASANANTLDDYEEGTWTPTIGGDSTAGTQTYSSQIGRYTKIGQFIGIECRIVMTAKDAATAGNLVIFGLPFTSANIAAAAAGMSTATTSSLTLTAGNTQVGLQVLQNATRAFFIQNGTGIASTAINSATALAATSAVVMGGNYST